MHCKVHAVVSVWFYSGRYALFPVLIQTSSAINAPSSSTWSFFALRSSLSCYETQTKPILIVSNSYMHSSKISLGVWLWGSGIGYTNQWLWRFWLEYKKNKELIFLFLSNWTNLQLKTYLWWDFWESTSDMSMIPI